MLPLPESCFRNLFVLNDFYRSLNRIAAKRIFLCRFVGRRPGCVQKTKKTSAALFFLYAFWLLLPPVLLTSPLRAQIYIHNRTVDTESFVQRLFPEQSDDLDYESLYESIFQYYRRPLNLNAADRAELEALYLLSETQIYNFFRHREKYGKLLSLYELQAIEGFDLETIERMLPFVTLTNAHLQADNASLLERIRREENHYLLFRHDRTLESKRGYRPKSEGEPPPYAGSPDRWYLRYRVAHSKDFSLGFTMEKDAGEKFRWSPANRQYGPDFFSFHFSLQNRGRLKHLTVGDYRIQLGQSLLLSAGFQVGKGSETTATVRRNTLGPVPYTSVLESGFFRGVAATLKFNRWELTPFLSYKKIDANVRAADTLDNQESYVSSLLASGYHRTQSELAGRKAIGEFVGGNHLAYQSRNKRLSLGFTGLYTRFGKDFIRTKSDYNQFFFRGKENWNLGANAHYNLQNFSFFGEIASARSGGIGFVGGWVASFARQVQMSMLFRHFGRDFHSFYGNPFAETSGAINETGIYWGIKYSPSRQWVFVGFYDLFRFPWLRFQADAPSQGREALLRATWKISKKIKLYAQFRNEARARNQTANTGNTDFLETAIKRQWRLNVQYRAERIISLQTRWQFSNYQQASYSEGMVLLQDLNFDFGKLRIGGRVALFDTDDFQNRQYVYEKNVLYAFSFPAYYGQGIRRYFLFRYKVNKKLEFWAKYALSQYEGRKSISSGNERIEGNVRTDFRWQVRYRF